MANKQAYPKTKKCKGCGISYDRDLLSKRGLCSHCSYNRVLRCVKDLQSRSGIYYNRWLLGCRLAKERKLKGGLNAKTNTLEKQA